MSATASRIETKDDPLAPWRQLLAGGTVEAAAFPSLPPVRLPHQTEAASFRHPFGKAFTEHLDALTGESSYARFTVLLTVLRQLLARASGVGDLVLGAPVFQATFEPGLRNTLVPLPRRVSPDESFLDAIASEKEVVLQARSLQNTPIAKFFELQERPYRPDALGVILSLESLQHERYARDEKAPCIFHFEDRKDLYAVTAYFDPHRYDPRAIQLILERFEQLLPSACKDPQARFATLEGLPRAERDTIQSWGHRHPTATQRSSLLTRFSEVCAKCADKVALIEDGREETFTTLDHQSEIVAHRLGQAGVTAGDRVGLYLPRSIEAIVAMIGILKTGASYVPLDPFQVASRTRFVLSDSGLDLVVTKTKWSQNRLLENKRCLILDSIVEDVSTTTRTTAKVPPEAVAYILYTSGSTGTPKGVEISHTGLVHLLGNENSFGLNAEDVVLHHSPLTFDASAFEIWGGLLNGATLVVASENTLSLDQLSDHLSRHQVSALLLTAALFRLVTEEAPSCLSPLHHLFVGGDVFPLEAARRIETTFTGALWNLYGPTENTIVSTQHRVFLPPNEITPPIGMAVPGTETHILDRQLRPVPIGSVGELFLGGTGLASGYHARPKLTAEGFLPHPFSGKPGQRIYATGDLCRYNLHGEIEFVGRRDHQVKIRGFRLELGEVEHALRQHPEVSDAITVLSPGAQEEKRLHAYYVPISRHRVSAHELRNFLEGRLASHALPAAFVELATFPLNAHGKVDRESLPSPSTAEAGRIIVSPSTPTEEVLCRVWSEVLGRDGIGVHENFYELGGDSLLAMQVVSRANKAGLALSAKQFFRHPTIAFCARALNQRKEINPPPPSATVRASQEIPLAPIQRWFLKTCQVDPHHFNLSLLLDLPSSIEPRPMQRAIGHLVEHHEALRLNFFQKAGRWFQRVGETDREWFERISLNELPSDRGEERKREIMQARQEGFELSSGPLIRFVFFERPGHVPQLFIAAHHLILDVVSWRILLEDLEELHRNEAQGKAARLTVETASYADWSERLERFGQSSAKELDQGRRYWLQHAPIQRSSRLRSDHREALLSKDLRLLAARLPSALTRFITRTFPQSSQATTEEILLAGWISAFTQWEPCSSVAITLDRHGREALPEDLDVFRTIGWFTSFFPALFEWAEGSELSFPKALECVRASLSRIPRQGVDYGILRYLGSESERATLEALGTPEICFNYLGEFDQTLENSEIFRLTEEDLGTTKSERHRCDHLLEINASVIEGQLCLHTIFHQGHFEKSEIQDLLDRFLQTLHGIPNLSA